MRSVIVIAYLILLPAGVLLSIRLSVSGTPEPGKVTISFSPRVTQLTLREPVMLNLRIDNGLSRPIKVNLGKDFKENFLISVTRPDVSFFHAPQIKREGIGLIGIASIAPGQTYNQKLLLNEWVDFNAQGRYEVEIRLSGTGQENTTTIVTGNKVTFEIGPKDTSKLDKVCGSLGKDIASASSYQRAAEAALALSYVRDPVAVPYLERVLRSGHLVERMAVEGLEQIGNREAVQVLVSSLKTRAGDTAILARSALERIESNTQDPAIREAIKRALSRSI